MRRNKVNVLLSIKIVIYLKCEFEVLYDNSTEISEILSGLIKTL